MRQGGILGGSVQQNDVEIQASKTAAADSFRASGRGLS